jgi:hypothetical protein
MGDEGLARKAEFFGHMRCGLSACVNRHAPRFQESLAPGLSFEMLAFQIQTVSSQLEKTKEST